MTTQGVSRVGCGGDVGQISFSECSSLTWGVLPPLMTLVHEHLMCPLPSCFTRCLGKLADGNGSCRHSNGFLLAMMATTS